MPKKTSVRQATPNYASITYWRKFAAHRIFFFGIAVIFAASIIAYFASPGNLPGGGRGPGDSQTAIAVVNGEPITREAFESAWDRQQRQMRMFNMGADTPVAIAQQQGRALDEFVRTAVLRSAAKKRGLRVSDETIDEKIAEFKKSGPDGKPISDADWKEIVAGQWGSEDAMREQLREGLLTEVLRESFAQKHKVTEDDLLKSYEEIKVRRILIPISQGRAALPGALPEAQAKQRAEKLLAELRAGADFEKLADEFSLDPSNQRPVLDPKTKKSVTKKNGGLINAQNPVDPGWYRRGGAPGPEFDEAAFKLGKGEISEVVKTPEGYQIIKVEDTRRKLPDNYAKEKASLIKNLQMSRSQKDYQDFESSEIKAARIEWRDPRMEWRYAFAKGPDMTNPMGDPQGKREEEILAKLRQFVAKDKDDSAAFLVLGQALDQKLMMSPIKPKSLTDAEKKKLEDEIIVSYEQALVKAEDRSARFRLGALYKERKETAKALAHYEKLMRLMSYDSDPNVRFSYEQLAKNFTEMGRKDLSEQAMARYVELTKKADEQRKKEEEQRKKDEAARKAEAEKKKAEEKAGVKTGGAAAKPAGATVQPGGSVTVSPGPTGGAAKPADTRSEPKTP